MFKIPCRDVRDFLYICFMKKLKTFGKAIAGALILIFVYCIYTADRVIMSFTPRTLTRFMLWSEIKLKEDERTYKTMLNSFARVSVVSLIIWLVWVFI